MRRLRELHARGMDLAVRWVAAVHELEDAERRLDRLEATRDRQVARLVEGLTARQRAAIEQHPDLSWRSSRGRRYREAIRRRQVWAHRKHKVWALEAAWEPRLAEAGQKVDHARQARAVVAREAARFALDPEPYVGRTRRQLARLGAKPAGAASCP
jgi:hypothetical protein